MASRMDKYDSNYADSVHSRLQKNNNLYEELYTNKVYTEFTDIDDTNIIDLSKVSSTSTNNRRENYKQSKFLNNDETVGKIFDSEEKLDEEENKSYNINDILDNARKNRSDDEIERKRRLKTVEYNILSDLNQEKLKEYRESKEKLLKNDKENLEELIHTITSNSLRKKIDDQLLGDLMPSDESETVISEELLQEIDNRTNNGDYDYEQEDTMEQTGIDKSFYTKSMDLSEEDFDQESDESFIEEKELSTSKKIIIAIFILAVIGIIGYIVYKFI